MAEKSLSYANEVTWESGRRGRSESPGRPAIAVGAPPEFGGTDDVWSPEHLTAAAVNACLMLTFIAVAEGSKLRFHHYTSTATATLEKVEGRGMVITKVVVRPQITIPADTDRDRLDRVLQLTKKNCFISNSLAADVTLEAEVVTV
jgi:organic hydroperoxide reductase OsmC/OhrA